MKLPSFSEPRLECTVATWQILPSGAKILIVNVLPEATPRALANIEDRFGVLIALPMARELLTLE
jgi:hypothetical protein